MDGVLTILLAGGAGERLHPLTCEQAKPALPFGGIYRLIDVTLSNCVNSGLLRLYILTQHKALTLNRHIRQAWHFLPPELDAFVETLPPMKRNRDTWYLGTADAVYQNLASIAEDAPPYTLILSADHVYKMNYRHMLDWHVAHQADVTVATTRVAPAESGRFGIVSVDGGCRVVGFAEKPPYAAGDSPANGDFRTASLGIYLFSTPVLLEALSADAEDPRSTHDFGRDVLPALVVSAAVSSYEFVDENRKTLRYWRDVGTPDAYYDANMDLVAVDPEFNLYDEHWPLRTVAPGLPPAKFVFGSQPDRVGSAIDSLVSPGCIVSGGRVVRSVLSPRVRVNSYSLVEDSIVFENVSIGRNCRIGRAIIDANLDIPAGLIVGQSSDQDREAGHHVTDSGIVVLHEGSPGVRKKLTRAPAILRRAPEPARWLPAGKPNGTQAIAAP